MKFFCLLSPVVAAIVLAGCVSEDASSDDDPNGSEQQTDGISACSALPLPVYHRVNPSTNASLYTTTASEAANAGTKYGFTDDRGIPFYVAGAAATGLLPVYRLYNAKNNDFFWTIDESERASAKASGGYVDQSINFYASKTAQSCLVPVYRYFSAALAKHRFAVTQGQRDALAAAGWTSEGIRLYAAPEAGTTPPPPPPPATYGAGSQPIGTPCVNPKVTVNPSMTTPAIQSAIVGAGNGAYICFASGTYRLTDRIMPLNGQTFHGSPNTVIKGSVVLTGAAVSGTRFVFSNVPLATTGPRQASKQWCEDVTNFPCAYQEDVFVDGKPLQRAPSLASVTAGSFYTDYATKQVYVGSNPAGHTVEIGKVPTGLLIGNENVTIEGFIVEMFASPMDQGAVGFGANGGVARNNEVRLNHSNGIVSWVSNTKFQYNRAHDNGQTGISVSKKPTVVIDHNDVIHNNVFGYWRNDGAEGGIKIDLTSGAVITNNYVKDNLSFGIYFDENADNAIIDNNYVEGNWAAGINFVFSRTARIAHNVVLNNGLGYATSRGGAGCDATRVSCLNAGIHLANSSGADIFDNTVKGNANGIALVEFNRDQATVAWTIPHTKDNKVHDNVITLGGHATGARQFGGPAGYSIIASNNTFTNNTYHVVSLTSASFWWNSLMTRQQWQAAGNDKTGTFLSP